MPNVVAAARNVSSKHFAVASYSMDTRKSLVDLRKWVSSMHITFPVIYDGRGTKGKAVTRYGLRSIPGIFMIDPKGRVVLENMHGEAISHIARKLTAVGQKFKPIGVTATPVDKKPTAQGLRVHVAVRNPEGSEYTIRVDCGYYIGTSSEPKYCSAELQGKGNSFVGQVTVPVPLNAMEVGMSPAVYSTILGEYVYGDAVFVGG